MTNNMFTRTEIHSILDNAINHVLRQRDQYLADHNLSRGAKTGYDTCLAELCTLYNTFDSAKNQAADTAASDTPDTAPSRRCLSVDEYFDLYHKQVKERLSVPILTADLQKRMNDTEDMLLNIYNRDPAELLSIWNQEESAAEKKAELEEAV